ncbi:MAG TPA: intradiol ring-cleavage dioxygenase [Fulvivirga sp.]|nr:intradiol ring-cleavage dioxygenase [Fulvivirga sp.]
MKKYLILYCSLIVFTTCQSQPGKEGEARHVGGPCEGCEAIYEFGDKLLTPVDTLPEFAAATTKIKITGTVFQKDGHTPAKNVILYVYQTNSKGIYEKREGETGWAQRHGHFRGWMKTNADGQYTFYTFRPGSYPNTSEPQHIHLTVKEPDKNEYYLDSYIFDDDPLLTKAKRERLDNRGGSGIIKLQSGDSISIAKRDIILGLNIPDYD